MCQVFAVFFLFLNVVTFRYCSSAVHFFPGLTILLLSSLVQFLQLFLRARCTLCQEMLHFWLMNHFLGTKIQLNGVMSGIFHRFN